MARLSRPRRDAGRPEPAGFAALVEHLTGLTAAGAIVLVGSVGGFVLAKTVGGRAMFLLVYAGILMVVAAIVTSRRRRRVPAERAALPTRVPAGPPAEGR